MSTEADEGAERVQNSFEAARTKIEYYMHENLRELRYIYRLTVGVMILGFVIIVIGAFPAHTASAASIVVTISGVLVQFIGATFLLIYKSTMAQAGGYVSILERINTVGMSLDLIKDISDIQLRDKTYAQIPTQILSLHQL